MTAPLPFTLHIRERRKLRRPLSRGQMVCWLVSLAFHGLLSLLLLFGVDRRGVADGMRGGRSDQSFTVIATLMSETSEGRRPPVTVTVDSDSEALAEFTEPVAQPESTQGETDPTADEAPEIVATEQTEPQPTNVPRPRKSSALQDLYASLSDPNEVNAVRVAPLQATEDAPSQAVPPELTASVAPEDVPDPAGLGGTGGSKGAGTNGPSGAGTAPALGSPDGASFFHLKARGKHFCYVVDCSNSMEEGKTIHVARRELWASLLRLEPRQKFQLIFYNADLFTLERGGQTAFPATDVNRQFALQFMKSQQPDGRAIHQPALLAALKSRPDAVFFLTDGEIPELTARELHELKRNNPRTIPIHVVEFGQGAKLESNWLEQLARDHRGTYRYEDILEQETARR